MDAKRLEELEHYTQETVYPDEIARTLSKWRAKGYRLAEKMRGMTRRFKSPEGETEMPLWILIFAPCH